MQQVHAVLKEAEEKKCCVLLSSITLGDALKITEREVGLVKAQAVQAVVEQLPIPIVSCMEDIVLEVAHLRAHASTSYPGAFAAVLAMQSNGVLCTGDPEYQPLKEKIKIEWLRTAQSCSP